MSHVRQCRQGGFRYTGLNVDAAPRSPVDNIEPRAIERGLRVEAIVREAGGRLYPAKDGRMPRDMFRAGYPDWERFAAHVDPRFSSLFWTRVGS